MVAPGVYILGVFVIDIILMIYVSSQRKKYADKLEAYKKSKKKGFWSYAIYIAWIIFLAVAFPLFGNDVKKIIFPLFLAALFGLLTIALIIALFEINKAKKLS